MKLEELEEQLRGILQRTEEIKKEIETLKNQNKPVTFIPEELEEYYYPYCSNVSGVYEPATSCGNGSGIYQTDAFETEEQCQKACDVLNKIMPIIKFAIENPDSAKYELMFLQGKRIKLEIFFADHNGYAAARKLAGETDE